MKKAILIILSFLLIAVISVWFSCNPFQQNGKGSSSNFSVLDELNGARLIITTTIIVNNSIWDGLGMHLDSSQLPREEWNAEPIFKVTNGTVKNVILDPPTAAGIILNGSCTVSNVTFPEFNSEPWNFWAIEMFPNPYPPTGSDSVTLSDITVNKTPNGNIYDDIFYVSDIGSLNLKNIKLTTGRRVIYHNSNIPLTMHIDGAQLSNITGYIVDSVNRGNPTVIYWRNITCNLPQSSWFQGGNITVYPY